jgi:flagellar biosynthesis/type III secretory pathway ATPase
MFKTKSLSAILMLACSLSFFAQAQEEIRFTSDGNPLITHHYTADPAALVEGDTFRLFTGVL